MLTFRVVCEMSCVGRNRSTTIVRALDWRASSAVPCPEMPCKAVDTLPLLPFKRQREDEPSPFPSVSVSGTALSHGQEADEVYRK